MAGDWIKVEHTTPDKGEVFEMAIALGIKRNEVVGGLLRLWIWADQQSYDGSIKNRINRATIDELTCINGLADALIDAGWLVETDAGLMFPHFDRHNGETAKQRALTARRVARHKARADDGNDAIVTSALPREEKRREEKKTPHTPQGATIDERFEAWWTIVPRKVGKAAAKRAYKKAVGLVRKEKGYSLAEAHTFLAETMKAFAGSPKAKGDFCPHPSTWLNQGRYDDDPAAWTDKRVEANRTPTLEDLLR